LAEQGKFYRLAQLGDRTVFYQDFVNQQVFDRHSQGAIAIDLKGEPNPKQYDKFSKHALSNRRLAE